MLYRETLVLNLIHADCPGISNNPTLTDSLEDIEGLSLMSINRILRACTTCF